MNGKQTRKKFLIIDKSGWDSYTWSIPNDHLTSEGINDFFTSQGITPVITHEAVEAGEFSQFSYKPNLFSGDLLLGSLEPIDKYENENFCFSELDGSLTTKLLSPYGLEVFIESASQPVSLTATDDFWEYNLSTEVLKHIGTYLEYQSNLWEYSSHWEYLTLPDKSVACLQRDFVAKHFSTLTASLVNDWHLREQMRVEGHQVYGSVSMLAGMVFVGNLSTQKATQIFYKWKKIDRKWVPRDLSFREVLSTERERVRSGTSFWVNK